MKRWCRGGERYDFYHCFSLWRIFQIFKALKRKMYTNLFAHCVCLIEAGLECCCKSSNLIKFFLYLFCLVSSSGPSDRWSWYSLCFLRSLYWMHCFRSLYWMHFSLKWMFPSVEGLKGLQRIFRNLYLIPLSLIYWLVLKSLTQKLFKNYYVQMQAINETRWQ